MATTKNIYRGYPHFLILTKVLHTVGGPAEGAVIVHQEDNAPPHQEGDFHAWLVEEFQKRGWRLELQAPQGPYTNVLDLQVKIIMPLQLRLPVTCILSIR